MRAEGRRAQLGVLARGQVRAPERQVGSQARGRPAGRAGRGQARQLALRQAQLARLRDLARRAAAARRPDALCMGQVTTAGVGATYSRRPSSARARTLPASWEAAAALFH